MHVVPAHTKRAKHDAHCIAHFPLYTPQVTKTVESQGFRVKANYVTEAQQIINIYKNSWVTRPQSKRKPYHLHNSLVVQKDVLEEPY